MLIANPIYDSVFKYLMDDSKIAKLLISAIIGQKILKLEPRPQEYVVETSAPGTLKTIAFKGRASSLTVYRLDFSAKIQTPEGHKTVLIEIQKAKFHTDIMRFRRYLGNQYGSMDNTVVKKIGGRGRRQGIPIVSIYFIGHWLDHTKASVIGVNRVYKDLVTGELIDAKETFIESLTHDSFIVQIPALAQRRRTELERLLSVFDQSNAESDHHILNVSEEDFPAKYRPLIRRLQQAAVEPEIKQKMKIEDEILTELEDKEREIETLAEALEIARQESESARDREARMEQEKQRAEQEKARIAQENELLRKKLEELERNKDLQ
jgi:hypothetical protein